MDRVVWVGQAIRELVVTQERKALLGLMDHQDLLDLR